MRAADVAHCHIKGDVLDAAYPKPHDDPNGSGLVAAGRTNKETGAALLIGVATVKTHVQYILMKLEAEDRAAAVATGYRRRLL